MGSKVGMSMGNRHPCPLPWERASCLLEYLLGVFHKALHSTLGQLCPAFTSHPMTGTVPKSHQLLFALPCPCSQGEDGQWALWSKAGSSPEGSGNSRRATGPGGSREGEEKQVHK